MNHKAQAALEFVTTYGWAIIIVLVMVSAMAYFGVFDLFKFTPDVCTFGSKLDCKSSSLVSDGMKLRLMNNLGENVVINNVIVSSKGTELDCTSPMAGESWSKKTIKNIDVRCDFSSLGFVEGDKKKLELKINYTGAFNRIVEGEISAVVQSGEIGLSDIEYLKSMDGLISWYRMNDDPSDGIDDEMNRNPGTCTNCPALTTDNWGNANQAYEFDGINDEINLGNNPSIANLNANITILAWINFTNTPTISDTIIGKPNWNWHFQLVSNNKITFRRWNPYMSTSSNMALIQNKWHHISTTLSSNPINNNKMYIDGTLDNTGTITTPLGGTGGITEISGYVQSDIDWFDGLIDEVMIFNRSLTASEIDTIYGLDLS